MGVLGESILFYAVFMMLRTFAGGVHAKTETTCTILTTLALLASLYAIKQLEELGCKVIPLIMLAFGSITVFLLSPLDSKEKPVEGYEKERYRIICRWMLVLCVTTALIANVLFFHGIFYTLVCAVFLESILLIAGKICNSR